MLDSADSREPGGAVALDTPIPTTEEIVARATALIPALLERAPEAEALRRVPEASRADIAAAGLTRTMLSAHYGGYEKDYRAFGHVIRELARGCASTAWCSSGWVSQAWSLSHFSVQAQDEVCANGPDIFIATTGTPSAKAEPVEGGWLINGRWPFASGVHGADWIIAGTAMPDGRSRYILIRTDELEVLDTWYTTGLAGTGSNDTVAHNVFIPEHRTLDGRDYFLGRTTAPFIAGPMANHHPLLAATVSIFAPVSVGNAIGFLDEFVAGAGKRTILYALTRQAEHIPTQHRLTESSVEVDIAGMLLERCFDTLDEHASTGELDLPTRARLRRDTAFAGNIAYRAIDRLYHVAGGHALAASSSLQRRWRDAHAIISQPQFHWDVEAEAWGKVRLGLETKHPLL